MRGGAGAHMPMRMLWMIWKMADPQTTKMNSASSQGPTDAFSSGAVLEVLATFPRCVMFLLCFSLAMRMRCLATMVRPRRAGPGPLRSAGHVFFLPDSEATQTDTSLNPSAGQLMNFANEPRLENGTRRPRGGQKCTTVCEELGNAPC